VQHQFITIKDTNISYQIRNESAVKSIFLIHGWALKGTENWQSFLDKLAEQRPDYKILSLDLPGFGLSQPPKEVWGVAEYSKFVSELLDKLSINPDVIIAHSFGGAITVEYLSKLKAEYATKVEVENDDKSANSKVKRSRSNPKLILMAPAIVRQNPSFIKKTLQKIFSTGKKILILLKLEKFYTKLRQILYKFYGSTDYLKSDKIMSEIFLKVINQDCVNLLKNLDNQTLILWGEKDAQTPLWQSKIIDSKLKNSKLIIIENARHAIHLQAEEKVLAEIEKFIEFKNDYQ
jgi:pimeloyl-ACP methyl ester carboxylesterase